MKNHINLNKELKEFIWDRTGVKVHDNSLLFTELGLIGLDADLFMDEFSEKFNVDISEMVFDKYFLEEMSVPFYYWYLKYFKPDRLRRTEFTLAHLIEVVQKGKWFDPLL